MTLPRTAGLYVLTVVLLAGTLAIRGASSRRIPGVLLQPLDTIESNLAGWTLAKQSTLPAYTVKALKPSSYLVRTYTKGPAAAELFIAYYSQQRSGESMHSPKHCLPGAGWEILRTGSAAIPLDGRTVTINKYSIANSGQSELMFYWYQSKDRVIADEFVGKFFLAEDALLTGQTAASIVRITLPDNKNAEADGIAIATQLIAQVNRCFRGTGTM